MPSNQENDELILSNNNNSNINLKEMRTNLKEIENNFRSSICGDNAKRIYLHKKGKAPQPPVKPVETPTIDKSLNATPNVPSFTQTKTYYPMETEL